MILTVYYIAPSTNVTYAGQHWTQRRLHKASAEGAVASALFLQKLTGVKFMDPVVITVEPLLGKGKRTYDVSNYSYTYKLIEDSLVKRGILQGDSPEYVATVVFKKPERSAKTGVRISICTL